MAGGELNDCISSGQDRVLEIIAHQAVLSVYDIKPEATPDDLGIDSIGLVKAIFAIEEAFDLEVPYNANEPGVGNFDISSVATIVQAVEGLVKAKSG